jgi:monoamine oxidase
MVAFAGQWLSSMFGSEVAAAVKKSSVTRWNATPFALGAMSSAAPGGQPSRRILTEPVGPLFLAGEATHETLWGTVDGAWESGERAADAALQRIAALRDTSTAQVPPPRAPRPRHRAAPNRDAIPASPID